MLQPERFFRNFFEDERYTSPRLYEFAIDVIAKLQAANVNNQFNTFINALSPAANALGDEVGVIKTALALQKGKTLGLNEVIKNFKTYMSLNHGVIARAVGGTNTAAYQAFYPQGITEYSTATQTKLPALLIQVSNAADLYASQIGDEIRNELKAFNSQFHDTRNAQLLQKGTVGESRVERSTNRKVLELELLKTIHSIALMFPADVEKCTSLFNFKLLEAQKKGKKIMPESGNP